MDIDALQTEFNAADLVEVVTLSAWQFGGPAMLTSWGAESYKTDGQVVLAALPVRLAYNDEFDQLARAGAPLPPIPWPPLFPVKEALVPARRRLSPPPGWLEFLAPHPILPSTWSALYEAVVEGGDVEYRIKQLQRVLIAERVDCPEWAPAESSSLAAAGVGPSERRALRVFDLKAFTPREQAALRYTEGLVTSGKVDDDTFAELKRQFKESEIIELGYAVSVQNGASRVFRSLVRSGRMSATGTTA